MPEWKQRKLEPHQVKLATPLDASYTSIMKSTWWVLLVPMVSAASELPSLVFPQGIGVNIHFVTDHQKELDLIAAAWTLGDPHTLRIPAKLNSQQLTAAACDGHAFTPKYEGDALVRELTAAPQYVKLDGGQLLH